MKSSNPTKHIIIFGEHHTDPASICAIKESLIYLLSRGIKPVVCIEYHEDQSLDEVIAEIEIMIQNMELGLRYRENNILDKIKDLSLTQRYEYLWNNLESIKNNLIKINPDNAKLSEDMLHNMACSFIAYDRFKQDLQLLKFIKSQNIDFISMDNPWDQSSSHKEDLEEKLNTSTRHGRENSRIELMVKSINHAAEKHSVVLVNTGVSHVKRLAAHLNANPTTNINIYPLFVGQSLTYKQESEQLRRSPHELLAGDSGTIRNLIIQTARLDIHLQERDVGYFSSPTLRLIIDSVVQQHKPKQYYVPNINETKKSKIAELGGTLEGNLLSIDSTQLKKPVREMLGIESKKLTNLSVHAQLLLASNKQITLEKVEGQLPNTFVVTFPNTTENIQLVEKALKPVSELILDPEYRSRVENYKSEEKYETKEIEEKYKEAQKPNNSSRIFYLATAIAAVGVLIAAMTNINRLLGNSQDSQAGISI